MLEPLEFIDRAEDPKVEEMRSKRAKPWPVGRLGSEVEIQFMHYENANEAKIKWNRRVARMPKDPKCNFFKFDDRDQASEQQLLEFSSLPLRKKVMFCGKHKTKPGRVTIPEGSDSVPDGLELSKISRRYFDACAWISGRKMRPGSFLSLL